MSLQSADNSNAPNQVTQQTQTPQPGTPEYEAHMAEIGRKHLEKQEAKPTTPNQEVLGTPPATKPEGIPDKFWDPKTGTVNYEAMAKSYTELEKRLGSKQPAAATEKNPANPLQIQKPETPAEAAAKFGMQAFTPFFEEYANNNGTLTDESYQKIEAMGFDRELVDAFIDGQLARTEREASKAISQVFEDRATYDEAVKWAAVNLSDADLATFNAQVMQSKEAATMALDWLKGKYERSTASSAKPALVQGGTGSTTSSQGFTSRNEAVAAINDPRYGKDSAYTAEVQRRIANAKPGLL